MRTISVIIEVFLLILVKFGFARRTSNIESGGYLQFFYSISPAELPNYSSFPVPHIRVAGTNHKIT